MLNEFTDKQLSALLERCIVTARAAGAAILRVRGESNEVRYKADDSPLTRADEASHALIYEALPAFEPSLPVLSEEGGATAESLVGSYAFWLVDPLDGTKEFVKGLDEYTVNIALILESRPVLGVVYAPALDTIWAGSRGSAPVRSVAGAAPEQIAASTGTKPATAVVSRSHMSEATSEFLEANSITESVSHGSSIKICAIADGSADVYPRYGPTNTWDTAAGAAVAIAAGCRIVDPAGEDLRYDTAGGTLRPAFIVHPSAMTINLP